MPVETYSYQSQLGRLSQIVQTLQGQGAQAPATGMVQPVPSGTIMVPQGITTPWPGAPRDAYIPSNQTPWQPTVTAPNGQQQPGISGQTYVDLGAMAPSGSYVPQVAPVPTPPVPAPVSRASAVQTNPWNRRWSENDVRYLARAIAAEARGEISKYLDTGNRAYRESAVGIGYVIARTAVDRGESIMEVIRNQPMFLSSFGMGHASGNSDNFRQFYQDPGRIPNWETTLEIAREALAGRDPSGIDPNHFYDVSIAHDPPDWAHGARQKRIANIIFVNNVG